MKGDTKMSGNRTRCSSNKLALAVTLAVLGNSSCCTLSYAGITWPDKIVDETNINTSYNNSIYEVNGTQHTYAGADQDERDYTVAIKLNSNSVWRPMDRSRGSYVTIAEGMTMENGSTLDLAYKYSAMNGYDRDWPLKDDTREFDIVGGELGDNITFRINLGTRNAEVRSDGSYASATGYSDKVTLEDIALIDKSADAVSHINVEYVLNKTFAGRNWTMVADPLLKGKVTGVLYITPTDQILLDKFVVTGAATNQVDGALNKYVIGTELLFDKEDSYAGIYNSYSVFWNAQKQSFLSQGAYSAANAALSMRNLWRIEDGLLDKRGAALRFANCSQEAEDFSGREGIWADVWRGKYTYDGVQGSAFKQNYSGIQLGFDKLRNGELYGGKLYTGIFISKMDSKADFYAQNAGGADYNSSQGDLESLGIGAYGIWLGSKGHYLESDFRYSRIENEYKYTDSFSDVFKKDFTGKTYGLGVRYGRRIDREDGWFLEPQLGLSYGVMRQFDFRLSNGLKYNQEKMDTLLGRAGLTVGKSFGSDAARGQVYAKAAVNHDFMDGGDAVMYVMQSSDNYNLAQSVLASQKVDTLAGKDTWYDVTLGGSMKLGSASDGWVEVNKSFGGKVNTDWQINAGVAWHWGGATQAERDKHYGASKAVSQNEFRLPPATEGDLITTRTMPAGRVQLPQFKAVQEQVLSSDRAGTVSGKGAVMEANVDEVQTGAAAAEVSDDVVIGGDLGEFTLSGLTVEAQRPDWEKKLSPGTISVIDVPKYAGEHKTFADLLQTVPGVYIDRTAGGGTGHYSTVRVRGSSAAQVNIYLDGVLVNTGSEQAVNLENINMDNVERIEVYRGYIPARFAGAAMGGAINVVTKRPEKAGGKASYGMRSFNGYKGNIETTLPLGDGSLLIAANRDQAKGDFKYTKVPYEFQETKEDVSVERYRLNNAYQNTNIFTKWQDKNWFMKMNYTDNVTETPDSAMHRFSDISDEAYNQYVGDSYGRHKNLRTKKFELAVGRRQESGNLEWGWKLATSYQHKKALTVTVTPAGGVVGINHFRNNACEASVDGSWRMGKNNLLEFLGTARRETMKVAFDKDDNWSGIWGGSLDAAKYYIPKYDMSNYYLQLQDTMYLDSSGSLSFTPLVRAQRSEIGIEVQDGASWLYSYNLGLKKRFGDHWTAWATYGTYYKTPSWYEVFGDGLSLKSRWNEMSSVANWGPEVSTEKGINWDMSVNWNGEALGATNDVTLSYFHRDAKDLMTTVFNPLYGTSWYVNYGAGKIEGVELAHKMHWRRLDLSLSATWQNSLITEGFKEGRNMSNTSVEGMPFAWTPKLEMNVRLDYRLPGDKLSIFGEYHWIDELSYFSIGGYRSYYDALGLVNVGLKYNFDKQWQLVAGINDVENKGPQQLLNASDLSSLPYHNVAYPQQGRTYYATVEYSF